MALTEVYVDPSIAADSGTGTSTGDPYGDLQYALNQETVGSKRFNIKAGPTAESLTGALDMTTFGASGFGTPTVFQGYTSQAGDGGVGSIDCNGNACITNNGNGIYWADMEIFDGPTSGYTLEVAQYSTIFNVYIHGASGGGLDLSIVNTAAYFCRIEDMGGVGVLMAQPDTVLLGCYIADGATNQFTTAVEATGSSPGRNISNNIIVVSGSANGINLQSTWRGIIVGNTVLNTSGDTTATGYGIRCGLSYGMMHFCFNNYVEGFAGTGGKGIWFDSASDQVMFYGGNLVADCATAYQVDGGALDVGGNETSASTTGLNKSGALTFANRNTYFKPVEIASLSMLDGAYPEAGRLLT